VPLFCDTALAGRIERAEAQLITGCCAAARRRIGAEGFAIAVAGGVASFAGEGSPYNKVASLGFAGLPDGAVLDDIERAFLVCGSPVQVELAHLADPAIGALLTGRGYRLESFENVLGRDLSGGLEPVMPPGVEVRRSDPEEAEAWLDVVVEGSMPRLADAAAAGCDVAVILTQPGSKSQQNAQRQDFDLLYTRAVLVKHPLEGDQHE
jgi:hypothetical protein